MSNFAIVAERILKLIRVLPFMCALIVFSHVALSRRARPTGMEMRRSFRGILFRSREKLLARRSGPNVTTTEQRASVTDSVGLSAGVTGAAGRAGLIVNADDWGQDRLNTNRILDCCQRGSVSSVSSMVFMEDSERASELAKENGIEAGLHLNFVTPFSAANSPAGLLERQQSLARWLKRHRFAQVVFHPGLVQDFEYVTAAQVDEFRRLYGADPEKLDGHHHMHLCVNVLVQRLMQPDTIVRRSFSFEAGEKSVWNILYRRGVDRSLAKRHRIADSFFSITPLEPSSRLQRIYSLARQSVVELETHPVNPDEYQYLVTGRIFREMGDTKIVAPSLALPRVAPDA
jgi:predicted glycoside hydrolase/deacetylase ChbG (UPF0249 family)